MMVNLLELARSQPVVECSILIVMTGYYYFQSSHDAPDKDGPKPAIISLNIGQYLFKSSVQHYTSRTQLCDICDELH